MKLIAAIILHLMMNPNPTPARRLVKDEAYRMEMATVFVEAANERNLDPVLLVVWAFGESSLRLDAVGAMGEVGVFQVHGKRKRKCVNDGYDLSDMAGQIRCGAMLIAESRDECYNIERGMWSYASGSCNGTPRARRITKRRFKRIEKLKELYR